MLSNRYMNRPGMNRVSPVSSLITVGPVDDRPGEASSAPSGPVHETTTETSDDDGDGAHRLHDAA